MVVFGQILSAGLSILNIPFTLWGHSFSLWQVFLFSTVVGIVARTVWEVIDGD